MNLDGGPPVRLSLYDYDDLGRVKTKDLGNGIEKQQFTYNIRGQLIGINAGYVFNPLWPDATFGCQLAYDYGYTSPRYDGAIAGFTWRGAGGSGRPRAYGYNYDRAGRMTSADFTQEHTMPVPIGAPLWQNQDLDYSVSDITYDRNGNMQSMTQRGMVPGVTTPQVIDALDYQYEDNSNRLKRVDDNNGATAQTNEGWHLGDFVNKGPNSTDYQYDADGNLTADENKEITSIIYNAQDLPVDVTVAGGKSIHNTYDASGTLLFKTVNDGSSIKEYLYAGPFVYQDKGLNYVLHEEGRARWLKDSLTWRYDFFVKDHLGNVRSTITWDNGRVSQYLATHELANAPAEMQLFSYGTLAQKPAPSASDQIGVRMNGAEAGNEIGTSLLLKVTAGDKFSASVAAYYDNGETPAGEEANSDKVISTLATALGGGITSFGTSEGMTGSILGSMVNSPQVNSVYGDLLNLNTDPSEPKAYLNWIKFDDQMNIVAEESGVRQIDGDSRNQWGTVQTGNDIMINDNGYLLVFMSNRSPRSVHIDNLNVSYSKGRLLEEQHYYPHGLVVRNATATRPSLVNRYLYQGKELQDELGLQLYDFHARQYDPQLGRFWGIDPADQFPSGYTGMGNDPANGIDPDGMQVLGGSPFGGGAISGGSPARDMSGAWTWVFGIGDGSRIWEDMHSGYVTDLDNRGNGGGGDGGSSGSEKQKGEVKNNQTQQTNGDPWVGANSKGYTWWDGQGITAHAPMTKEEREKRSIEAQARYDENLAEALFRAKMGGYLPFQPDVIGVSVPVTLLGVTGYSGSVNVGIVGNQPGVWFTGGISHGIPEASIGIGVFMGEYTGNNPNGPTLDDYMGRGDALNAGAGPIAVGFSRALDNNGSTLFRTYSVGYSHGSRSLPVMPSLNYGYNFSWKLLPR